MAVKLMYTPKLQNDAFCWLEFIVQTLGHLRLLTTKSRFKYPEFKANKYSIYKT